MFLYLKPKAHSTETKKT